MVVWDPFNTAPSIVTIVKSMRLWWPGQVTSIGETRNICRILVWKPLRK